MVEFSINLQGLFEMATIGSFAGIAGTRHFTVSFGCFKQMHTLLEL
jgi:hypothetical protein